MSSLIDTKFWSVISPWIRAESYIREGGGSRNPRHRLEIKHDIPPSIARQALDFEMPCVACGFDIHPIRPRRAPSKRGNGIGHLYIAPSCPLNVHIGCSRSKATSIEYEKIYKALKRR